MKKYFAIFWIGVSCVLLIGCTAAAPPTPIVERAVPTAVGEIAAQDDDKSGLQSRIAQIDATEPPPPTATLPPTEPATEPPAPTDTPTASPTPLASPTPQPTYALPSYPVRIMPLGDSITEILAYRSALNDRLLAAGCEFNMVGSKNNAEFAAWDSDNEGHGGMTAYYLDFDPSLVTNWVASVEPNVVLLHIGTNDMLGGGPAEVTQRFIRSIISQVRSGQPQVMILLAQIIPSDQFDPGELNGYIAQIAAEMSTPASPIVLVDQASGFNVQQDTYDGIHPNTSGGEKMGERWYQALINAGVIANCTGAATPLE